MKNPNELIDHFFRNESNKLIAALTRVLGPRNIDLVEDIVQETLSKALHKWSFEGIPPSPSGWIFRAAHNVAIDALRRNKFLSSNQEKIAEHLNYLLASNEKSVYEVSPEIEDDVLRLMFACCDPILSRETQIALTLKILCSFHTKEIANALLKEEAAVHKLIERGKEKLKETTDIADFQKNIELGARLDTVLSNLYLLFNEGYKSSRGETLIRDQLCFEAIRLARLLTKHRFTHRTDTSAFLALLLFQSSRIPARVDDSGNMLLLKEQKRNLWDKSLIEEALYFLNLSSQGDQVSEYHLQAGIAACHAFAENYESTNWSKIIEPYTMLLTLNNSPIICLNRVVAILEGQGLENASRAFDEIELTKNLSSYYLYYLVRAELASRKKKYSDALVDMNMALTLTLNNIERKYILEKINAIKLLLIDK